MKQKWFKSILARLSFIFLFIIVLFSSIVPVDVDAFRDNFFLISNIHKWYAILGFIFPFILAVICYLLSQLIQITDRGTK